MFYVYVITNKITDKVYIGQSVNVQERLSKHFSQLRNGYHSNTYLQRSYNTYGRQCFEYYTLGEYVTKEEVNIAETFYISWFKLLDLCYDEALDSFYKAKKNFKVGEDVDRVLCSLSTAWLISRLMSQGFIKAGRNLQEHLKKSERKY